LQKIPKFIGIQQVNLVCLHLKNSKFLWQSTNHWPVDFNWAEHAGFCFKCLRSNGFGTLVKYTEIRGNSSTSPAKDMQKVWHSLFVQGFVIIK
jgi:hypothetical protein